MRRRSETDGIRDGKRVAGRALAALGRSVLIALVAAAATAPSAFAQPAASGLGPVHAPDVAFARRPGAALPLERPFTADDGRGVRLGAFFDGVHPVVLVPGYHRCPELCGLTMQGVLEALAASGLGADAYRVVRVSIDPDETAADARVRVDIDAAYAAGMVAPRGTSHSRWPPAIAGLVGAPASVEALDAALGYRARRLADSDGGGPVQAAGVDESLSHAPARWAHPAGFVVATPDGRIAQAFDGVRFDATALRRALVEAGDGRIGSLGERLLLVCGHLEPALGRHASTVLGLVRATALGSVLLLGFWIWRHRRRRPRTAA